MDIISEDSSDYLKYWKMKCYPLGNIKKQVEVIKAEGLRVVGLEDSEFLYEFGSEVFDEDDNWYEDMYYECRTEGNMC